MVDLQWVDDLPPDAKIALLNDINGYLEQTKLADYRPYRKQGEFHAAGAAKRERALIAANQVGKTLAASNEVAIHLTGQYPAWWKGHRFNRPNHWIAGSESGELTRRGVQRLLMGRDVKTAIGTGSIPAERIISSSAARGVADLLDTVQVRWGDNGVSSISLKSYDQGRAKWQADTLDGVWFDEEPPEDVYMEGLTRTNTTLGPVLLTLTPLKGMSAVVKRYMIDKMDGTHYTVMTIDDAEHYSPEQRTAILAGYPAHEREARALGIPSMGSGLIFPVPEQDIVIAPIQIPDYWRQIGGLDFGWDHPTAGAKLAYDADTDVIYLTADYRAREAVPLIHAAALKPWGEIPWAWPHDGLQHDKGSGEQLAEQYRNHGLNLLPERSTFLDGTSGVEAGLQDMLERMQTGRWKVFNTCTSWLEERRMYHRKDGKVVKLMDDCISASRYAYMCLRHAQSKKEKALKWRAQIKNSGRSAMSA